MKHVIESIKDYFLIQSLKREGYRSADHSSAQMGFETGLNHETGHPDSALEEYRDARKRNAPSIPGFLWAATILPGLATLVAYSLIRRLDAEALNTGYTVWFGCQFLLAYLPILLVYAWKLQENRFEYRENKPGHIWLAVAGAIVIMLQDVWAVINVFLLGTLFTLPVTLLAIWVFGSPINDPNNWTPGIYYPILGLVILAGSLLYFADLPWGKYLLPPKEYSGLDPSDKRRWWSHSLRSMLRQIPAGLACHLGKILQTAAHLAYYYWTVRMAGRVLEMRLADTFWFAALLGFMVGIVFRRLPDDPLLDHLAALGEVRCLLRLGRVYAAQAKVRSLLATTTIPTVAMLAQTLYSAKFAIEPGWPEPLRKLNRERTREKFKSASAQAWSLPYATAWKKSLDNTRYAILGSVLEDMFRAHLTESPKSAARESREITDAMLRADELEAADPKSAMREYIHVQRLNTNHYPILSVMGIFLPIIATVITYKVVKMMGEEAFCLGLLVSITIQLFVGYFPIFQLRSKLLLRTRLRYEKRRDPNPAQTTIFGSLMVLSNEFLAVLGVVFFGFLLSFPALWLVGRIAGLSLDGMVDWPRPFYYFAVGLILLMGCSFYLTNMPISPYFFTPPEYNTLREPYAKFRWWQMSMKSLVLQVPAGWVKNWELIKQTLASLIFTYLIGRIALDISNFPLVEAVLTGAFAGLLLAGGVSKIENDPLIEGLAIMGRIRCLMRLGKFASALEWIWEIRNYSFFGPLRPLAATMEEYITYLQGGWPNEYRAHKRKTALQWFVDLEKEAWDLSYPNFWHAGLKNSRLLMSK